MAQFFLDPVDAFTTLRHDLNHGRLWTVPLIPFHRLLLIFIIRLSGLFLIDGDASVHHLIDNVVVAVVDVVCHDSGHGQLGVRLGNGSAVPRIERQMGGLPGQRRTRLGYT